MLDAEAERLSLSLLHKNGSRIARDEAASALSFEEMAERLEPGSLETSLGDVLRRALNEDQSELS